MVDMLSFHTGTYKSNYPSLRHINRPLISADLGYIYLSLSVPCSFIVWGSHRLGLTICIQKSYKTCSQLQSVQLHKRHQSKGLHTTNMMRLICQKLIPVATFTNITLIQACISNYIHYEVCDEITFLFLNFNGATNRCNH